MISFDEWLDDIPKEIIKYPSRILKNNNDLVLNFDDKLQKVVNEMFQIMYSNRGIGLSAPQVALNYKFFILNATGDASNPEQEKIFINPEVISYGIRKAEMKEGCLSLPGIHGTIERSRRFLFSAYDLKGNKHKYAFEGMQSRIAQHEYHHLLGVLIIDVMKLDELIKYKDVLDRLEEDMVLPF